MMRSQLQILRTAVTERARSSAPWAKSVSSIRAAATFRTPGNNNKNIGLGFFVGFGVGVSSVYQLCNSYEGARENVERDLVQVAGQACNEDPLQSKAFVIQFSGDSQASQVENLRHEVTAILLSGASVSRGDQDVVLLNSSGGEVSGYGLAAAQLERLKDAGLHVTVCVDQCAASGG